MMKKITWTICSLLLLVFYTSGTFAQDRLLTILKQELGKQMKELKQKEHAPYYMNYRVVDEQKQSLRASFGVMMDVQESRQRSFVPQIRLGNAGCDNFKNQDMGTEIAPGRGARMGNMPFGENATEEAIRQVIWDEVCARYDYAVDSYLKMKVDDVLNIDNQDKSPCLAEAVAEKYYEAPVPEEKRKVDTEKWSERLCNISKALKAYPELLEGSATLNQQVVRTYFVSSEGAEVVHNLTYSRLTVSGQTMAEDGMVLPLMLSYFAFDADKLPDDATIIKDAQQMAQTLVALRTAPVVDAYTGPAVLSGEASGVFFHEIFGHRIEGQRMRGDMDGQTFRKMVGELVLPAGIQVYDDPALKQYQGQDLNGFYKYDEQGVKAERVDVVVDGKMNDFLMTRKTMKGFPKSNGHARAMGGFDPVSRQSNLVIETKEHKTDAELRALLLEEAKKQGKEYGYFFKAVNGGFTMMDARAINSFNVSPLEVYRIYTDGRPDELVRGVDIVGTPLTMFSAIAYAGGDSKVFTGMCGAESGWVPVTAISPSILVKKVEMQRKAKSNVLPPLTGKPSSENKIR